MSPNTPSHIALLCVLALALTASACGRTRADIQWEDDIIRAERLFDNRNIDEARALYTQLLQKPHLQRDVPHLSYRLAYLDELSGHSSKALRAYEALWRNAPADDEVAAKAHYRTGHIAYHTLNDPAEGLAVWTRTVVLFHPTVAADKALRDILYHFNQRKQHAEALTVAQRLYPKLAPTILGDNLLYEQGRQLRALQRHDQAIAIMETVLERYPLSGLADDALWDIASIYEDTERIPQALNTLRMITEDRDASWYLGDYDSAYADDARFKRGLIYLDTLNSFDNAEREFSLFLKEFPESILRDDARWNIVQARLGAGNSQGAQNACADLARIEPESRWVDDCQTLSTSLQAGTPAHTLRRPAAD